MATHQRVATSGCRVCIMKLKVPTAEMHGHARHGTVTHVCCCMLHRGCRGSANAVLLQLNAQRTETPLKMKKKIMHNLGMHVDILRF